MMKREFLTDEEIHEICQFYQVDYDDMKAELKERKELAHPMDDSDIRTYAKDIEKRAKKRGLFRR